MPNKIQRFLRLIYLKIVRIDDSPQRVAIGFGIGVFLGIMPGMGPIASLVCAAALRVNRASALLASILTNTWLSIPVFLLSVRVGAAITGTRAADIQKAWHALIDHFSWTRLLEASLYKIAGPVLAGYAVVSTVFAFSVYAIALTVLVIAHKKHGTGSR